MKIICLFINILLGISQGNVSDWNQLWNLFILEQEPQEKQNFMRALTASKDKIVLTR